MKFFRHLTAVVLAPAVIVGLGMLWAHACGGTGSGSGLRQAPSREALLRLEQGKVGVIRVHSGTGFHLADTGDLIRTCVIEAVLAAGVITVSAVRRRHRRGRRTAVARASSGMQLPPRTAARSRYVARKYPPFGATAAISTHVCSRTQIGLICSERNVDLIVTETTDKLSRVPQWDLRSAGQPCRACSRETRLLASVC